MSLSYIWKALNLPWREYLLFNSLPESRFVDSRHAQRPLSWKRRLPLSLSMVDAIYFRLFTLVMWCDVTVALQSASLTKLGRDTHQKQVPFHSFLCKLSSFNDCLPYLLLLLVALVVKIDLLIKHPYSAKTRADPKAGGSIYEYYVQKERRMLEAIRTQPSWTSSNFIIALHRTSSQLSVRTSQTLLQPCRLLLLARHISLLPLQTSKNASNQSRMLRMVTTIDLDSSAPWIRVYSVKHCILCSRRFRHGT